MGFVWSLIKKTVFSVLYPWPKSWCNYQVLLWHVAQNTQVTCLSCSLCFVGFLCMMLKTVQTNTCPARQFCKSSEGRKSPNQTTDWTWIARNEMTSNDDEFTCAWWTQSHHCCCWPVQLPTKFQSTAESSEPDKILQLCWSIAISVAGF